MLWNFIESCATEKAEWEAGSMTRSEELAAFAETIRLWSDGDALELFKKTLPSPSLLQPKHNSEAFKEQVVWFLKMAGGHEDPRWCWSCVLVQARARVLKRFWK